MSWITQNKFLAGFGAAMVVGVGALGYLTYSAMDRSSSTDTEYHNALDELKRLQGGHPYPDKANRDKIVAQKAAYQEKITAFQKHLADTVHPVESLSPTEFQDKLKETVARITAKASGDARLTLAPEKAAEKFYMGFPEYASKSPEKALVPQLSRELLAFESIINLMLAAKDVTLIELKREEPKPAREEPRPRPGPGGAPMANPKAEQKLVRHSGFTLKFTSSDAAFRNILNGIVDNKEHFFIVRKIAVHNSKLQSPDKKNDAPPPNIPAPSDPKAPTAPTPPETKEKLEYIFGTELVSAHLEIELVDFTKPETRPVRAGNNSREGQH